MIAILVFSERPWDQLFLLYYHINTLFFRLPLDQRDQFMRSWRRHLVINLSFDIELWLRVLFLKLILIFLSRVGLLQLIKEFLSMWSHLRARSSSHILLDFLPILSVLHDSYMKGDIPYMNRWCYSFVHLPACFSPAPPFYCIGYPISIYNAR